MGADAGYTMTLKNVVVSGSGRLRDMTPSILSPPSARDLSDWVVDARRKTLALVADLTDEQLMGPRLSLVNPLLWEIGHVAWFQERWVLRHANRRASIRADGDALYDSAKVAHDTRWDLALPSRDETVAYMTAIRDQVLERLEARPSSADERYFIMLAVFHEDMHTEAFTITRQTLGYPAPRLTGYPSGLSTGGPLPGDVAIPGGTFQLGGAPEEPFVFDNEKWSHPIEILPFAIARAPVTQAEFAAFVEDGGYRWRSLWCDAGWRWRESASAEYPAYWRRDSSREWQRRHFDQWLPLEPHLPVINVNWYEADAYCRWAGRRLPTEAEWEAAASAAPDGRQLASHKRRFPWGGDMLTQERANLDGRGGGCLEVGALPAGDSAFGCRQMIGNVWEWTSDDFLPYPGFVVDPYKEYSQPWFKTHKVLRGGCWATRTRLLRNTWRNFYEPHRRDVFAGFRTCAI
jgi:iron(II)-dependent oxidoreductase